MAQTVAGPTVTLSASRDRSHDASFLPGLASCGISRTALERDTMHKRFAESATQYDVTNAALEFSRWERRRASLTHQLLKAEARLHEAREILLSNADAYTVPQSAPVDRA